MMSFTHTWLQTLGEILSQGTKTSPRGQATYDTPHRTIVVDMRDPVLRVPARKLSYQFMAAEAFWMLSGDDSTLGIVPWNKHIMQFSDDGERFFGAYGPKILGQLDFVIAKLTSDPHTRQACLTIWRENPMATKDVPCTVAMTFRLRTLGQGLFLDHHVFMRSSDAWLGLPYDVFNFSMVGHLVCARYNQESAKARSHSGVVEPGNLYLTMVSSHLYERDEAGARECIGQTILHEKKLTPTDLHMDPKLLLDVLRVLRDTRPGHPLRWWEK